MLNNSTQLFHKKTIDEKEIDLVKEKKEFTEMMKRIE